MNRNSAYNNFLCLIETLQALAAEYKVQKEAFPSYVCLSDELVLNFDDRYLFLDQYKFHKIIDSKQEEILKNLNIQISILSKNENLWTDDALQNSKEWEKIRQLAKQTLQALSIEQKPPDLNWITYLKN